MASANAVLLTNDIKIRAAYIDRMRAETNIVSDATSVTITMAQTKFQKNTINILVLDTDANNIDLKFIKMLMEKHMLYVVALGRRIVYNDPGIQFVMKPSVVTNENAAATAALIALKVRTIAGGAPPLTARDMHSYVDAKHRLVAIGSSTGGTEALAEVLPCLPKDSPPVLVVQHMPSGFTKQLADRIDKISAVTVKEAQNGEFIRAGCVYIAPGDQHMRMIIRQQRLSLECFMGDRMHGVRPAADILFDTVARISGPNAIGVILTGMGSDGARGLVEMHKRGAKVIGQDKETCVVYGMPRVAFELGAVDYQLPLESIAGKLIELFRR